MTDERVIRVFVSSTFRDMQAERDELVKRVFPEVRAACEARGVTFTEIDLRWGVTDEQKAEGAVLPICLREIELSRPYFIGLLGQRYGWVPDELPADLVARLGWLGDDPGRSVTEMEIVHGVLGDPAMDARAYFYLRDPAWLDGLPPDQRAELTDGDPELEARLDALKARVRASGFPVRDYPDPVGLGPLVRADLLALLDRLFPADGDDDPLDAEAAEHAAYAATRFDAYVERPADMAALDARIAGEGPPLVVTGDSGSGKSALVANWVRRVRARAGAPPVIEHYCGASARSADWPAIAARLIGEAGRVTGNPLAVPPEPEALRVALARALNEMAAAGPVVLVLDGVDQVHVDEGGMPLHWLPEEVPPGVRLVVSAKPGPALDELARRGWPARRVEPLTDDERSELVRTYLARYSKGLGREHTAALLGSPLTRNPLFLVAVLDELRQHGDHFTLDQVIAGYLEVATIDDLYERILARWERDFERDRPGLVADTFRALWAARRGLTEAELLGLLGGDEPLPRAAWSPLFLAAERSLVTRSGVIGFFHDHLRTAVRDRYVSSAAERRAAHAALADFFGRRPVGRRVVDELAWQQAEAGDWEGVAATLGRPDVLALAHRTNRFDLRAQWARLEAASRHRLADAYADLLARPADDEDAAWALARLLDDTGHHDRSAPLHAALVAHFRVTGNGARERGALLNQGAALLATDDVAAAEAAFATLEEAARAAGDHAMVRRALSNRAVALRARREGEAALELLAEEEAACRAADDVPGLQACLANQGGVLDDLGRFDEAMERFVEQERLARRIGDPELVGRALGGQAAIHAVRANWVESDRRYDEWAACCRQVGDRAGLQAVLGNQAVNLYRQGRFDDALARVAQSEELARAIGSPSGEARSLLIRAMVQHARGDLDDALATLVRHEPLARELHDRNALALGYGERGTIRRERGDLDGALADHVEEERLYREIDSPSGVATSLGNQAAVHLARGDAASASALWEQQEAAFRALGDVANLQVVLGNRGAVLLGAGDLAGALALLAEQEQVARAAGIPAGVASAVGNIGLVRFQQGDLDGADAAFAEQERICTDIGDAQGLQTCLGNRAALAVQRGDLAGALALMHRQAAICRDGGFGPALQKCLGFVAEISARLGDAEGARAAAAEAAALGGLPTPPAPAATAPVGATDLQQGMALLQAQRFDDAFAAFGRAADAGDDQVRQLALEQQALICMQRQDWPTMLRLLADQEDVARRLGDRNALQSCLGNRAIARRYTGDLPGALADVEEQAAICREIGNVQGLVIASANRGELLCNLPGRKEEGLAALVEAERLAQQAGMAPMAQQIAQLARQLRAQGN